MHARWRWLVAGGIVLLAVAAAQFLRSAPVNEGPYRIGFEDDPPFHFRGPDGKPVGLAVEIVNEAARRAGITLEWSYQARSSEMALRSGAVDLWPLMTIRSERRPFVYITEPYRESESCLLVRADRPYSGPRDVDGGMIVHNGQPLAAVIIHRDLPSARLGVIEDARGLVEAVCQGRADAAFMDEFTVVTTLMNGADCRGSRLRTINVPAMHGQLGIGATFAAARAADRLRAAITDMAEEGKLSSLVARWSYFTGKSMELNTALIQSKRRERVMIAATTAALSLLLLTAWLADRARRQRKRALRAEEERNRLEAHLQQAQRLEGIGRLAGGVAHDFNNLLTVINGNAELLAADDTLPAPHRAGLLQIGDAGRQAARLTQQLLAFSRKQIIQPKPLNLNAAVDGIKEILQRLVGEDVELASALEPNLALTLADPTQMHQVLMNLAVNARDAMPNGGKLEISTANVSLEPGDPAIAPDGAPGDYVRLSVADSGLGIDEETLRHIFEPFFTTKGKGEGTGLGLSMVYGIVRQSKGWIVARSRPGQGTRFDIYLPRADETAQEVKAPEGGGSHAPGAETILLVEDQASVRKLAATVLRRCGYQVLEAPDAEEALVASRNHPGPIHLLFTDVVLPAMNGKELADRLKGERPDLKVLFASGYTDEVIAHRGVLMPGIRYLPKPYGPGILAAEVRKALDRPDD
jgi:two-component system, cell cycle sensor histidine kinase and response regulator CckA